MGRVIQSLINQAFIDFEVILVLQGHYPGVADALVVGNVIHKIIHFPEAVGVSKARNCGASIAIADYLIFLDDDDDVTSNWLSDFNNSTLEDLYPDLLRCGLKVINKSKIKIRQANDPSTNMLAGSWAIKRELFSKAGGYEESLRYGENTEFHFRVSRLRPTIIETNNVNFIYNQSNGIGKKNNFQSQIDFVKFILKRHENILNENLNIKFLYTQKAGVCCLRLDRNGEGYKFLLTAYLLKPFRFDTLIRLVVSKFPLISRLIYSNS